jgi:GT2 family glycosyltransferase
MDAPASEPRLLVLVLTWNGRALTEACLDSVLRLEGPPRDVLVVDNASTDDTVPALAARYGDRITVLRNAQNLLFAGGINLGLHRALDGGYDAVLLLNNDVVLDPAMVRELLAVLAQDERIAAVGPKIYYFDQPNVLWFAGGEMPLWRGWSRHRGLRQTDRGQHDVACDVDYLTGCAFLVRAAALRDVGLLDPGYSMYAEDADWSFRARERGWRLVYAPRARMWHRVSASAGAHSGFKMKRRIASQWRFLRRHARWYHWLAIPFGTVAEAVRVLGVLLRR